MTRKPFEIVVAAFMLVCAFPVEAEQNWIVRGRILTVAPSDSSGAVSTLPGSAVSVDSDTTLELDITYMFTSNVGVELIFGTSQHGLRGEGSIAPLGKIAEARTLPPVLTLQYHFFPQGRLVRPYAGIGVNYTRFYDEKTSESLDAALGPTSLELDSSTGLVAQVGVDIPFNERWFINFDAKYVRMDTTARLNSSGTVRTVEVDIDPWFFGFGIGTRF